MCGITGLFSTDGLGPHREALQAANQLIEHRGPDGQGFALFDVQDSDRRHLSLSGELPDASAMNSMTLALGHRRLAIIDLSPTGSQPMTNEDETLWIVYNGEIYNYLELRSELERAGHGFHSHSDTEVILHAYEAWGEDCVNRLNGMWAFALVDLKRRRLFCSRDRFGIKPFYYYCDDRHFVFGSEIKQLLCFSFVPRRINERAVYEFLAYSAVDYCDETFFDGICTLMQGHNLSFDLTGGSLTLARYYQPHLAIDHRLGSAEAAREFRRLLTDSVRLHLRSDVEVGSCLSGGLDSSSLVCVMHELLNAEKKGEIQRTFSSHFDDRDADELEYMQAVIRATGVRSHFTYPTAEDFLQDVERIVWHQDEPFGSTSIFAQWAVFKLVNQHGVKVMLDGQGADEQLAGYVTLAFYFFRELQAKGNYPALLWEILRYAQFHPDAWRGVLPPGRAGECLRRLKPAIARPPLDWIRPEFAGKYKDTSRYLPFQQVKPFGDAEHLNNILYQLTFHTNLQSLLRHEDRNSMAFSVESRVPYLDYRLVEFIFSLPSGLKIRNGYTKRVLRDGMAGLIPEITRWRTSKLGFATPERTWQKTALQPLLRQALADPRMGPFILPDKAAAYQERIRAAGLKDSAAWRWINLHLWMKAYRL